MDNTPYRYMDKQGNTYPFEMLGYDSHTATEVAGYIKVYWDYRNYEWTPFIHPPSIP